MSFVVSWSGGKDSALALARARQALGDDGIVLTMFTEGGERSRAHGLVRAILEAQATALGLPLVTGSATWDDYTPVFVRTLAGLRERQGVTAAVFGDIDLQAHRDWCLRACAEAGVECLHPLWGEPREALVQEAIARGIEATVVAVRADVLAPDLLGRRLDAGLLAEFAATGIDLAGEQGEYHTVVTGGPGFRAPLHLEPGARVLRDGYWFLDLALAAP
ncbi:MAG: diphthine--ammonia ligase [Xanthomonadales bacterium]|nr:diphthine--ammonia ligase [Xanthomonadales bacterium]